MGITSEEWAALKLRFEELLPDNIQFCDFKKCYPRPCSHKQGCSCIMMAFKEKKQ